MDTLTPANYFEGRDDCAMTCVIAAGFRDTGVRHSADCAIVADTGHAYREAVAREAERLRDPESEAAPRAYAMTVGHYTDEQVIGVHVTDSRLVADSLAAHLTAQRAARAGYGAGRIAADMIEVRAEPVDLLNHEGAAITARVRLEILP